MAMITRYSHVNKITLKKKTFVELFVKNVRTREVMGDNDMMGDNGLLVDYKNRVLAIAHFRILGSLENNIFYKLVYITAILNLRKLNKSTVY